MAKYTGPVCRLCRREGEKLYLKGDRCTSEKCAFTARAKRAAYAANPNKGAPAPEATAETTEAQTSAPRRSQRSSAPVRIAPPGQHGLSRKKPTEYSVQLREKQKCKRLYGLLEKQFRSYYDKADRMKGVTGENMLALLERRLDNVVFRARLGVSRAQARQMVNHGLITVNGKVVNIPSYLVKVGDVVSVKVSKKESALFEGYVMPTSNPRAEDSKEAKEWLRYESSEDSVVKVFVQAIPTRADCESTIKEHLIVELYSK